MSAHSVRTPGNCRNNQRDSCSLYLLVDPDGWASGTFATSRGRTRADATGPIAVHFQAKCQKLPNVFVHYFIDKYYKQLADNGAWSSRHRAGLAILNGQVSWKNVQNFISVALDLNRRQKFEGVLEAIWQQQLQLAVLLFCQLIDRLWQTQWMTQNEGGLWRLNNTDQDVFLVVSERMMKWACLGDSVTSQIINPARLIECI